MDPKEVLRKTLGWIAEQKVAAERPNADAFILTSLSFCAHKVAGFDDAEKARASLHYVVKTAEMPAYDVVTPEEASLVIRLALAIQN